MEKSGIVAHVLANLLHPAVRTKHPAQRLPHEAERRAMGPTTATLVNGSARFEDTSLIGLTVTAVRCLYKAAFHIADSARTTVNAREVDAEYSLKAGDVLVFDEPTGQKG